MSKTDIRTTDVTQVSKPFAMSPSEYDYWLKTKAAYETSLRNGVGHAESIKTLIQKIDQKLSKSVCKGSHV